MNHISLIKDKFHFKKSQTNVNIFWNYNFLMVFYYFMKSVWPTKYLLNQIC